MGSFDEGDLGDEFLESTEKVVDLLKVCFFLPFFSEKAHKKTPGFFGAEFKVSSHEVKRGVTSTLWVSFFFL